mgnify:CR=1 FL=1
MLFRSNKKSAGRILLATVKGDVHDIGKNIVSVVLACNNYEIIDLGVMVSADRIIEEAIKHEVDIVGLSGLITPSLDEMVHVAREMKRNNFQIPLLIGGATTSRIHTAVKIAPNYDMPVIHVLDASKSVPVVSNLLNENLKNDFIAQIKNEYDSLNQNYLKSNQKTNLSEYTLAKNNKYQIDWNDLNIKQPTFLGASHYINYDLSEIRKYINWTQFFITWEIKGKYPQIFENPEKGAEAKKLFDDANEMLDLIIVNNLIKANYGLFIYPANSINDEDIIVYDNTVDKNIICTFNFLRQQHQTKSNIPNYSLSDFVAPVESGKIDYLGGFVVTAGLGVEELSSKFTAHHDDYKSLMLKILADRMAEAFAELLHKEVRQKIWGYAYNEELNFEDLLSENYTGIRPAFGYPSIPDHSEIEKLFQLVDGEKIGVGITENYMMTPGASVSGLFFASPFSKYFAVGKINNEQLKSYAARKGISIEKARKLLSSYLAD